MSKIAVIGLGPIGLAVARAVQDDRSFSLCGLIDTDPAKLGKRLVDLDSSAARSDLLVVERLNLLQQKPDVVVVCTTSYFDRLAPMLETLIQNGIHAVSSCEEMAWPRHRHPDLSDRIDTLAKAAGVTLVGTGVNPGFVMDLLPVSLSSMLARVDRVKVTRVVDALTRRMPLQKKIGSTMTPAAFGDLALQNRIGHMGLPESVMMLATGLGRNPKSSDIHITLEPVIATKPIQSLVGLVQPGQVCGMHNRGTYRDSQLELELDLTMALAATDPRDEIELHGERTIRTVIPGSTPGDTATVAALLNVARKLPAAPRGLRTMLDLPPCGGAASSPDASHQR
jgi:4-hydroxy-tetrahydrodipicolinate reductase